MSDSMERIVPRTSPVFRTFSAERGDARAKRLTMGVPIITGDVLFRWLTLNPTDFIGVFIIAAAAAVVDDEFSFPSLLGRRTTGEFIPFIAERGGGATTSDLVLAVVVMDGPARGILEELLTTSWLPLRLLKEVPDDLIVLLGVES